MRQRAILAIIVAFAAAVVALLGAVPAGASDDLTQHQTTATPWLSVSGSFRARLESLAGQFRADPALGNTEDQLFSRSLLRFDARASRITGTLELIDARAVNTGTNSLANNSTVNTADVLQAAATWSLGRGHTLGVGRYTMDIGSRRLVARNRYRNTINSFNGLRWDYANKDNGYRAGAFWNLPTLRRPQARTQLVDNAHAFDRATLDYQFFGAHAELLRSGASRQFYVLGLRDRRDARDLKLWTVGGRYRREHRPGAWFGNLESAYQFGRREGRSVAAYFTHASVGYIGRGPRAPTVRLALDLASGDNAGANDTRFDPLFGARRFEYGPTGLYGALGRRNIVSHELRVSLRPSARTWFMLAWRNLDRHNTAERWVEANDDTGRGRRIGQQTECRLRFDARHTALRVEVGAAYLSGGRFRTTSEAQRATDTKYLFFETTLTF